MVSSAGLQARGPHRDSLAELNRHGDALFRMLQSRDDRSAGECSDESA